MNFLSFEYFLALSKASSLRDAAASLMISQQALSSHIQRLEQELDVPLLTKTRPVALTPCGKRFAEYAASMLVQREHLERELAELSGRKKAIYVSIPLNGCPPFISDVVVQFSKLMPNCLLHLEERPPRIMDEELKKYDFHISDSRLSSELEYIQIQSRQESIPVQDPDALESNYLAVIVHRDLLRAKWGECYEANKAQLLQTRQLSLMKDIPFIRSLTFHADTAVDKYFIEHAFAPATVACATNLETCLTLCCAGAGALIAPEGLVRRKIGSQLERMDLFRLDSAFPSVDLFISYTKGKLLSPQEQLFIRLVCDLSGRLASSGAAPSDVEQE